MKFGSFYQRHLIALYGEKFNAGMALDESAVAAGESRLGFGLPHALREYYRIAGNFTRLNNAFEYLWKVDELQMVSGALVFMQENQGAFVWGIREKNMTENNPEVFIGDVAAVAPEKKSYTSTADEPFHFYVPEWSSIDLKTDAFLKLVIYYNTSEAGYDYTGDCFDVEKVKQAIGPPWEKEIDHQGLQIWKHERKLIRFLDRLDFCHAAAADEKSMQEIEHVFGFERT